MPLAVIVMGELEALARCVAALETLRACQITIQVRERVVSAWLPGGEVRLRVVNATAAWCVEVEGAGANRVKMALWREDGPGESAAGDEQVATSQ